MGDETKYGEVKLNKRMDKIFYRGLNKKFNAKNLFIFTNKFHLFHHAYDFRKKDFKNIQNNLTLLVFIFDMVIASTLPY